MESKIEDQLNRKKSFIIKSIYIILIALIIYVIFKYVFWLVSPFILAFLIAYIIQKPTKKISAKLKVPHKFLSFFLVAIFYCTVGVMFSLIGIEIVSAVSRFVSALPRIYENQLGPFLISTFEILEKAVFRLNPGFVDVVNKGFEQFVSSLGQNITNISISLVGSISSIASSLPAFLIKILLMIISTFFIAMDFDTLAEFVLRQFSIKGRGIIQTIQLYMKNTLFVVIRSYALIMSITFIELSIGFSIIGIPNAVTVALIIAIFDILPVLGTGGIMIPWTIFTFIQGDFKMGALLLAVYVFVTIIRNILEPKIVGKQLGLHPVVVLMSIFVGANLFGALGLFGFPITLSLLKHLNDTNNLKIFK